MNGGRHVNLTSNMEDELKLVARMVADKPRQSRVKNSGVYLRLDRFFRYAGRKSRLSARRSKPTNPGHNRSRPGVAYPVLGKQFLDRSGLKSDFHGQSLLRGALTGARHILRQIDRDTLRTPFVNKIWNRYSMLSELHDVEGLFAQVDESPPFAIDEGQLFARERKSKRIRPMDKEDFLEPHPNAISESDFANELATDVYLGGRWYRAGALPLLRRKPLLDAIVGDPNLISLRDSTGRPVSTSTIKQPFYLKFPYNRANGNQFPSLKGTLETTIYPQINGRALKHVWKGPEIGKFASKIIARMRELRSQRIRDYQDRIHGPKVKYLTKRKYIAACTRLIINVMVDFSKRGHLLRVVLLHFLGEARYRKLRRCCRIMRARQKRKRIKLRNIHYHANAKKNSIKRFKARCRRGSRKALRKIRKFPEKTQLIRIFQRLYKARPNEKKLEDYQRLLTINKPDRTIKAIKLRSWAYRAIGARRLRNIHRIARREGMNPHEVTASMKATKPENCRKIVRVYKVRSRPGLKVHTRSNA